MVGAAVVRPLVDGRAGTRTMVAGLEAGVTLFDTADIYNPGRTAERERVRSAIAWALKQSPVVIPMPGASRPESVLDDVQAATLDLGQDEIDWLNGKNGLMEQREG